MKPDLIPQSRIRVVLLVGGTPLSPTPTPPNEGYGTAAAATSLENVRMITAPPADGN